MRIVRGYCFSLQDGDVMKIFLQKAPPSDTTTCFVMIILRWISTFQSWRITKASVTKWNAAAGLMLGNSEAAKSINQYIAYWRQLAYDAQEKLIKDGKVVSALS